MDLGLPVPIWPRSPKHSPIVNVGTIVSEITAYRESRKHLQGAPDTNHHIVNVDISVFWYDVPAVKT